MGGVVRFTACDILRERKRLTHTHAQRPLAHARIRLPHGPQSSSKQSLPYELRCPELMTYSGPAAPAGDDRDMFGGLLLYRLSIRRLRLPTTHVRSWACLLYTALSTLAARTLRVGD
jgi:hypothetical protein